MTLPANFTDRKVTFVFAPLAPLSWVSFAIETGALWFMGRNYFRLGVTRSIYSRSADSFNMELAIFPFATENSPRAFEFSGATTLETLVERKKLPERFTEPWSSEDMPNESILLSLGGWPLKTPLVEVAYSLGDLTVDFFKRGAFDVRAQFSRVQWQLRADVGLSPAQVRDLLDLNVRDYHPGDYVEQLPWANKNVSAAS